MKISLNPETVKLVKNYIESENSFMKSQEIKNVLDEQLTPQLQGKFLKVHHEFGDTVTYYKISNIEFLLEVNAIRLTGVMFNYHTYMSLFDYNEFASLPVDMKFTDDGVNLYFDHESIFNVYDDLEFVGEKEFVDVLKKASVKMIENII